MDEERQKGAGPGPAGRRHRKKRADVFQETSLLCTAFID
jgi:hypothetical protein